MRTGIIGGPGNAGWALCAEAVHRGHQVTAIVRKPDTAAALLGPDVAVLAKDAFDLVDDDLRGFDVIIDAFSTAPAQLTGTSTSQPGSSRFCAAPTRPEWSSSSARGV